MIATDIQLKEPSFVTVDGRKMAYDEVRPANPKGTILLLTGLGSKRLSWYYQLNVFGQHYRTIALDHRDTGDSDEASEPYTTADQADDAAAVLRALGVEKAHVIGISMGGFISLELALRHPRLVDKLVLISTSAGGAGHVMPGPDMMSILMRLGTPVEVGEMARRTYSSIMHADYVKNHPQELDLIAELARYQPQSQAGYARQLQAAITHNATDRLTKIKAPTLVVHGESDPLMPVENGLKLARNIPGTTLILYPDTGHVPIVERTEQFNRDVLAFLNN